MADHDDWLNTEFVSDDGRVINRRQMGYAAWKEGAEIVPLENGYRVRGEVFRPHNGE